MKRYVFLLLIIFLLCGCAMIPMRYKVNIISDPPGAKIEINDNYIGTAPLNTELIAYKDPNYLPPEIHSYFVIKAYPSQPGEFVQTKVITYPIPQTIYFNMNIDSVMPVVRTDQNIRIHNE